MTINVRVQATLTSLLVAFFLVSFSVTSQAKIIMFESKSCPSCLAFKRDFGKNRFKRVDVYSSKMKRYKRKLKYRVSFSPTFVKFSRGREVGRIIGYSGKSNFKKQLRRLKRK